MFSDSFGKNCRRNPREEITFTFDFTQMFIINFILWRILICWGNLHRILEQKLGGKIGISCRSRGIDYRYDGLLGWLRCAKRSVDID